jgi:hypothetical protein
VERLPGWSAGARHHRPDTIGSGVIQSLLQRGIVEAIVQAKGLDAPPAHKAILVAPKKKRTARV